MLSGPARYKALVSEQYNTSAAVRSARSPTAPVNPQPDTSGNLPMKIPLRPRFLPEPDDEPDVSELFFFFDQCGRKQTNAPAKAPRR
jgi:hypothetical protein